jgi:MraZ protein
MTQLWSFSEVPFDASGRFVLPEHLAELCGIGEGICFLGGGQFFTLWSPKQLYAMGAGWEGQQASAASSRPTRARASASERAPHVPSSLTR